MARGVHCRRRMRIAAFLLLLVAWRAPAPAEVRLAGRFSLFDGATDARLARGQALFNGRASASGRRCGSCHNAPNDGANVSGIRFDVRTVAKSRGVARFEVPSLRGIAASAPYSHNGSARTLRDVVRHYENALGFTFTAEEEDDLVAFLDAI